MGLSLHYKAELRDTNLRSKLVAEVQDICETMEWFYQVWDQTIELPKKSPIDGGEENAVRLEGIAFSPHDKCEFVWLLFTPDGKLTNPVNMMMSADYPNSVSAWWVHTKTQFAGPEEHIAIVKLLKYLSKKYFKETEVVDEGKYWETEDETSLKKNFERNHLLIDTVAVALEQDMEAGTKDSEQLLNKIEEIIRKLMDEQGIDLDL